MEEFIENQNIKPEKPINGKAAVVGVLLFFSLIANIILGIILFMTAQASNPNKENLEQNYKLTRNDFTNKWENENSIFETKTNLIIVAKCDIVSITYTVDFYNDKDSIVRTLNQTKTNLKKNNSYTYSYTYKSGEVRWRFTLINGEVDPDTRPQIDIGSN